MNNDHPVTEDEVRAGLRGKATVLLSLAAAHGIDTQSFILLVAAQYGFNEVAAENAMMSALTDAERATVARNNTLRTVALETGRTMAHEGIARRNAMIHSSAKGDA